MTNENWDKGLFRNSDGKRVKLGKAATAEVIAAWNSWKDAPFNQYIAGRETRAQYNETNRRGKQLVEIQTKHNVWLIHPVNATAGLRPDDERIID